MVIEDTTERGVESGVDWSDSGSQGQVPEHWTSTREIPNHNPTEVLVRVKEECWHCHVHLNVNR